MTRLDAIRERLAANEGDRRYQTYFPASDVVWLLETVEIASAFLAKVNALQPAIDNAFLIQQIHGMPYQGDNYGTELQALTARLEELE